MIRNLSTAAFGKTTVTLNLFHLAVTAFQGPFVRSSSGRVEQWMLKQVQHDGVLMEAAESSTSFDGGGDCGGGD